MGRAEDALLGIRAQLADRIEGLVEQAERLPTARIAAEVNEVRRMAADHGLSAVAQLAHVLSSRLGNGSGAISTRPFLEAMRDAAGCDLAGPQVSAAYLAALGQRFPA